MKQKASFYIEERIFSMLKVQAYYENKNMSELVEGIIRDYCVKNKRKIVEYINENYENKK